MPAWIYVLAVVAVFHPFRCPTCGSRQKSMHPASSDGGEVIRICPDHWHDGDPVTEHARQQQAEWGIA